MLTTTGKEGRIAWPRWPNDWGKRPKGQVVPKPLAHSMPLSGEAWLYNGVKVNRGPPFNSSKKPPPNQEETIAAISTPFGESGIGIVRISGSSAEPIARRLFKPKKDQFRFIPHQFHYGEIIDNQSGNPVDYVLLVLMKSPNTYTKEDILQLLCHGGYFILQKVL